MTINQTLREIGLNENEIKIYLILQKSGRLRPSAIAKLTKINRATIYSLAKDLIAKGIIAEDLGGSTLYLNALPPESLYQIIERSKRDLDKKKDLIEDAISELKQSSLKNVYLIPKIRFIEEEKIEDFLYQNTDIWLEELLRTDGVWWGFQDHTFAENYQKYIEWVSKNKRYKNSKIKSCLLSNQTEIEQKIKEKISREKREVRFLPDLNFISSIWISGDYTVMLQTKQRPFYLVEIHDKNLSQNFREVIKKLWSLTK